MEEKKSQPTPQDMDTVRFISLVSMFASSAYMSMGKIANPATGKSERDLDAARGFIDILVMLKARTAGNLTRDEEKMISSTISDLQMNFVREKEKPEPSPPAGEEKAGPEEAPPAGEKPAEKAGPEEAPPAGEKPAEKAGGEKKASGPIVTPPPEEGEGEKG